MTNKSSVIKPREKLKYNIGDRVGKLTILSYERKPYNSKGHIRGYYHCLCECGKEVDIVKYRLEEGTTRSCGCLRETTIKVNVGDIYGQLTVLEEIRKQDKRGYWEYYYRCSCSCGKETVVRKYELISGNTVSCGCKSSKLIMGDIIRDYKKKQRSYPSSLYDILSDVDKIKLEDKSLSSMDMVNVQCSQCGAYFGKLLGNLCFITGISEYKSVCLCPSCSGRRSKLEVDLLSYIRSIFNGIIEQNKRGLLNNSSYELDIYIPELKLGLEVNGMYWHSTEGKYLLTSKNKTYHFDKWKAYKESGIHLLSIFEQDWVLKNDKVKSILKSFLFPKNRVYARDTELKEIDNRVARSFLNQYHYDGYSQQGTIALGLFSKKDNSLLSVMLFGHLRGQNLDHCNLNYYEIVRYATVSQTIVIGGASKLLKHFEKEYDPDYILSYSDNDFFSGDVYSKLGFSFVSYGEKSIDYQWVKKDLTEIVPRQMAQPWRLQREYPELYEEAKSKGISIENYVMVNKDYYKVYRCGNSKWEWRKK